MTAIPAKADTSWVPGWYREKYDPWSRQVQPLIESRQYGLAFKTYPFLGFDQTPWSPVQIPLSDVSLGVVNTAGLYRRDVDPPFKDGPDGEGDSRVIELPRDVDPGTLATAHTHIPRDLIEADVNVTLPLDHLRALVREGRIKEIGSRMFCLIGSRSRADLVATETAPRIAGAMVEDGVTLAPVIPA